MSIVDGNQIAKTIYDEVSRDIGMLTRAPKLAIFTCDPQFETKKYLELKRRKAALVGIEITIIELLSTASTEDVMQSISVVLPEVDGVVVQLPLPARIDREQVLGSIPDLKDPDCFSGSGLVLPPVVGAIDQISSRESVTWDGKQVIVVGHGRLVGAPAAQYAERKGAHVTVVTESSVDTKEQFANADIIITGAGQPNLVTKDMVKEGVVIFDAATSEDDGELRGDVSIDVAEKASVFTPVPGGIGPITVAVLLSNLVALLQRRNEA